jgi:bifunctional enzyme CysN/CysC
VAVILVDARKGLLTQTRRHSYLVSLVGIRHVVLAVNKMDLVDYDEERFDAIRRDYEAFAAPLGFGSIAAIPISALKGDNIIERSQSTSWYTGPTLMNHLETVAVADDAGSHPFRLPVQWVNRPHLDFRGFCGTIASGTVRPGDPVQVTASGRSSRVARIVTMDGDLQVAVAGQAVTLTLEDEIDISRGDLLASPAALPAHSARIEANLVWLHEDALEPGRSYLLKSGSGVIPARVEAVGHRVNVNTLEQEPGGTLELNGIGVCRLVLDRPAAFDPYGDNRGTGSFILMDRLSNATVAAGMFIAPLAEERQRTIPLELRVKEASPAVVWIDGPDNNDTMVAAREVEAELREQDQRTFLLAAGELQQGLNRDLDDGDGVEAARRIAEVARLLADQGLTVLVAAPLHDAEAVRAILADKALREIRLPRDWDITSGLLAELAA